MATSRDDDIEPESTVVASPSFDAMLDAQEGGRDTHIDDIGQDWDQDAPTTATLSYDEQLARAGLPPPVEDEPTAFDVPASSAWQDEPSATGAVLPKTMILGPESWSAPVAPMPEPVPFAPPTPAPVVMATPAAAPRGPSNLVLFAITAGVTFVVGSCVAGGLLAYLLRG